MGTTVIFAVITIIFSSLVDHCYGQCSAKDVLAQPPPPAVPNSDLLSRLPGKCNPGSFDCGEKCIAFSQVQDCVVDCANGYDESCWAGQTRCDGCLCVDTKDADTFCFDRTGQSKICTLNPSDIYQCVYNSLNCVLTTWLMDGYNDCGDWSDENPCCHSNTNCASGYNCHYIIPNNFTCVPTASTDTTTTSRIGSTTPSSISPTTASTANRTVCSSAKPHNTSLMRENPISVAILLRTNPAFQGERQTLINSFPNLLTSIKFTPDRVKNYLLAPFVDSKAGYSTLTSSPISLLQSLQNLDITAGTGRSCYENTLTQISLALSSLEQRSFMLIFTDADCSDAKTAQSLIRTLQQKEIQVNFILTGNCTFNFNFSTYQEISMATGGEVFLTNSLSDIYGIMTYLSENLRSNYVMFDYTEATDVQNTIVGTYPIDSTLTEVVASVTAKSALSVEIAGTSVDIFHGSTTVSTKLNTNGIKSATVASVSLSYSRLKIFGVGWPDIKVKFTSNPNSNNITFTSAPIFGVQTYLVFTFDHEDLVDLTLNRVEIHEITSTTPYFSGPVTSSINFTHTAGPFRPNCNYFVVKVFGSNKCGEAFVRAGRFHMKAVELDAGVMLSGNCSVKSQLDCGDGHCIDLGKFRDCQSDCSSGFDEALPMDTLHCANSYCNPCNTSPSPPVTPTTTTTTTAVTTATQTTTAAPTTSSSSTTTTKTNPTTTTPATTQTAKPTSVVTTFSPIYTTLTTSKPFTCANNSWCAKNGTFQCDNFMCIPQSWVSDGSNDCGDGSDERKNKTATSLSDDELYQRLFNNSCANRTGSFQCRSNLCIPLSQFRDCKTNCPTAEDEGCVSSYVENALCKCENPSVPDTNSTVDFQIIKVCTQHNMFICKDKQYCVKQSNVFDGIKDCMDGSDEDPIFVDECTMKLDRCSPNAFCLKIPGEVYSCVCKFGFFGNGTFCELLPGMLFSYGPN